MAFLKCEWCDRNASTTIRLPTGKLTGICLNHIDAIPTTTDASGTRHIAAGVTVTQECDGWGLHPYDCHHSITVITDSETPSHTDERLAEIADEGSLPD